MSPRGRFDPWPALRAACLAAAVVAGPSTALSQQDLSPAPTIDVVGTTLRVRLADGSSREGIALVGAVLSVASSGRTIRVRIAGAEPDASDPHGEILLYDFRLITPRGEEPFCAPDPDGRRVGFPLAGRSDRPAPVFQRPQHLRVGLHLRRPGQVRAVRLRAMAAGTRRPSHDRLVNACIRLLRADYCGDGRPFTRDGTLVDIYDHLGAHRSDADPRLSFEAAWGPEGAVRVARTRLPDIIDLDGIGQACPRLAGRLVPAACSENVPGGLIFNRSLQGAPR